MIINKLRLKVGLFHWKKSLYLSYCR